MSADVSPTAARLRPAPFALAVLAVYAASFLSQMLLSGPVAERLNVIPFAVAQVVLIGLWILLHRRRLHDAGRPGGIVIGIALIYALMIVLLCLLAVMVTSASAGNTGSGIVNLFVLFYLFVSMAGDPGAGAMQVWMVAFAVLLLLPVVIAIGFSVWAATRPSATTSP